MESTHPSIPDATFDISALSENEAMCRLIERVNNGSPIDWEYWSTRTNISPQQAARLATGLDPIRWPGDNQACGPILILEHIEAKSQWLAERASAGTLATYADLLDPHVPYTMREAAARCPVQAPKRSNLKKWDEHALRRLREEFREQGMTQETLARKYGVTRQRISALLVQAKALPGIGAPSLNPMATFTPKVRKTRRK